MSDDRHPLPGRCRICGEPFPTEDDARQCVDGHYERHQPCPDREDCWLCVEKAHDPTQSEWRKLLPISFPSGEVEA